MNENLPKLTLNKETIRDLNRAGKAEVGGKRTIITVCALCTGAAECGVPTSEVGC